MTQDDPGSRRGSSTPERRDLRFGLEEALDGELPEEMVRRMRSHTADCPECAEEWERMRRMKELVRRSCTDRAPSGLRERIALHCRTVSVTRTGADGSSVRVTRTETVRRELPGT